MSATSNRDRLRQLLEPVVTAGGGDLEDVVVTPAGRRRLLRVVVDADGGVSLDGIAALSTAISAALDDSDVMPGPYVLEVTSPGVDRPLTEPRHWRRAASRLVAAVLTAGGEVRGRVVEADEGGVTLDTGGGVRHLAYAEIARARVEVEFTRAGFAPEAENGDPENAKEA
jgi:ribosome maturation factor RimP